MSFLDISNSISPNQQRAIFARNQGKYQQISEAIEEMGCNGALRHEHAVPDFI